MASENGKIQSENLSQKMLESLDRTFGFKKFRGNQEQIILSALTGKSALVLMPTGHGKSLCFQLPAVLGSDLVLVISPLIALMQDQVMKLRKLGVAASTLNSMLSGEERQSRLKDLAEQKYRILYVTPERFRKPEFLEALAKNKISLLAIDEAHCISQWGHDFRPDYSRLGEIRKKLGSPPTLALTATATTNVQKDILIQLDLEEAPIFSDALARPNLRVVVDEVVGQDEKLQKIVGLRHQYPGTAILYFSLISTLQNFSRELAKLNLRHLVYHGDLSSQDRKSNQKRFVEDANQMILATPAFGLGVDKADVRLLIHAEMPGSIESYFQEIGRAGRDGQESVCQLFYDRDDVTIQMDFIKWANPDGNFIEKVYRLIEKNQLRIQQEGFHFLREQMNYFNRRDFRVETAVNVLERLGSLERDNSRFGFQTKQEPDLSLFQHKLIEDRVRNQNQKLLQMVRLAEMESGCRMREILTYFSADPTIEVKSCGRCDLCLAASPASSAP